MSLRTLVVNIYVEAGLTCRDSTSTAFALLQSSVARIYANPPPPARAILMVVVVLALAFMMFGWGECGDEGGV
jgi:hypothetical protein